MPTVSKGQKFKHVYCDAPKVDQRYNDWPPVNASGESSYAAASRTHFAVAKKGSGGPIVIRLYEELGRVDKDQKLINTHKGLVTCLNFCPHNSSILASGSNTGDVHIQNLPDETLGMPAHVHDPTQSLQLFGKKCTHVEWHPTAENVLASVCYDKRIALWDVETATSTVAYDKLVGCVTDYRWNETGSMAAWAEKDSKRICIADPRTQEVAMTWDSFSGNKSAKLFWIPEFNWVGSCGFTKQAKRVVKFWDLAKPDKPVGIWKKGGGASVLMPHMDHDHNVLYLVGKGDGSIEWVDIQKTSKVVQPLGIFRNAEPQKGGAWVPKTGLNVMGCEVQKYMKLAKNSVWPLSFVVPRKDKNFQEDIFPRAQSGVPSMNQAEYFEGKNVDDYMRCSLNPEDGEIPQGSGKVTFTKAKTKKELMGEVAALTEENESLKARVTELEEQVKSLQGN